MRRADLGESEREGRGKREDAHRGSFAYRLDTLTQSTSISCGNMVAWSGSTVKAGRFA
jgi:hypothetical protein